MKLTNNHNLPQTLINAVQRDAYTMGDARMSITGLLRPPRIGILAKKHGPDIVTDVSDHIYSLMGRAIHKVLEDGGDEEHLTEERLYTEVRGWRISGALDLQKLSENACRIVDYKTCSAYAVMNEKPDWTNQLNSYGHLIRAAKGWEVKSLAICAIIRDWNRHKVKTDEDYPSAPVAMIDIPVWASEAAAKFVEHRVHLHQEALSRFDMGDELPLCTDEERWMRPATWAVQRPNNKRPTKVFDREDDAERFRDERAQDAKIIHRPSEPIRCTNNYCQVAPWCSQHAAWVKENKK